MHPDEVVLSPILGFTRYENWQEVGIEPSARASDS
jgi:hypothetical protein